MNCQWDSITNCDAIKGCAKGNYEQSLTAFDFLLLLIIASIFAKTLQSNYISAENHIVTLPAGSNYFVCLVRLHQREFLFLENQFAQIHLT